MKKVLVTGGAGNIGINVIKYLLAEGKYDITVIDLPNKYSYNRLRKYHKRINIVYGDILDGNTVFELVKEQDFVIHLATCMPPLADLKKNLSDLIEVTGLKNIVNAINYCNKKCMLIYASSTSIYNTDKPVSVDLPIKENFDSLYSHSKYKAEKMVIKELKNYAIFRLPLVVGDLKKNNIVYNIPKDEMVEFISSEDASYALVNSLNKKNEINKLIFNIGGGDSCTALFSDLKKMILKYHGLSFSGLMVKIFIPKTYHSPVLLDSSKSNEILEYQNDSFESIAMKIKRRSKNRYIAKFFGKFGSLKKEAKK